MQTNSNFTHTKINMSKDSSDPSEVSIELEIEINNDSDELTGNNDFSSLQEKTHCSLNSVIDYDNVKAKPDIDTCSNTVHTTNTEGDKSKNKNRKVCLKKLKRKTNLKHHQCFGNKNRDKPFRCEFCEKTCVRRYNYYNHLQSHTEEKSLTCEMCQKKFSSYWDLEKHKKVHLNYQPFVCSRCGTKFRKNNNLKMHMFSHVLTRCKYLPSRNAKNFKCQHHTVYIGNRKFR